MEMREVLAALRRGWWMPLSAMLVTGGLALGVCLLQTPRYTASTQLFVSTTDSSSAADFVQGSQFSQQRVASYARLLAGDELARRVTEALREDLDPAEVADSIDVTVVPETVLIDVSITDTSPRRAQAIAATVGREFTSFAAELERTDADGVSPVKVTVSQPPELPGAPSSPQVIRNTALGLLIGLLLGCGIALVRSRLDRTVKNPEEASELTGAPVIGAVLRDAGLEKRHIVERSGANRTAEDYRQLRNNLQFLNVDQPPKVIMVSSALPSEGKTTAVVNLALALADAGRKVTIVEADLRKPKVTRYLGLVGGVGLTNVLAGTAELDEVMQSVGEGLVQVIAAGPTPPNPGELLASTHMASMLDKLRGPSDFVLIDAPPLLPVADSSGLAVHTDGVLLSVRYGSTRREQLQQAAATLERVGAVVLGVILNIVPPKADHASAYGYGYSYEVDQNRRGK